MLGVAFKKYIWISEIDIDYSIIDSIQKTDLSKKEHSKHLWIQLEIFNEIGRQAGRQAGISSGINKWSNYHYFPR